MNRKSLVLFIIFLFFIMFPVSAVQTPYLMPYAASTGVPMDSPYYKPVTSGWIDMNHGSDLGGHYSSYMTIATGGIRDIEWNQKAANSNINVNITIQSPVGMNFVSLKNPHITRPFELYVIFKHSSVIETKNADGMYVEKPFHKGGLSYPEPKPVLESKNFAIEKFDKSGQTISVSFPFRALIQNGKTNELSYNLAENERLKKKGKQKVWFDICLVLPGVSEPDSVTLVDQNNYITLDNGKKKLLVVADDYSANVTVDMDISCDLAPEMNVHESISIPLNGIYDGLRKPVPKDTGKVQLSIVPTSACNNLDLMKQQGQYIKIADVTLNASLQHNPLLPEKPNAKPLLPNPPKQAFMFVSSSPNPFTSGGEFVLKHRQAPEFGEYNTRNHMRYTVMLYEKGNPNYYEYDGTMSLDASKTSKEYLWGTTSPDGSAANMNKLAETKMVSPDLYFKDEYMYQTLNAELGLIMEDKQGLAMFKGAYTSKIYVHVVTDDDF